MYNNKTKVKKTQIIIIIKKKKKKKRQKKWESEKDLSLGILLGGVHSALWV
jgi:hypothetical protein